MDVPTVGEVLQDEFLTPLNLSQNVLGMSLGVPQNRISEIVNGKRGITTDTDLRLCRFFKLTDGYFLRLQNNLLIAQTKRAIGKQLAAIIPFSRAVNKMQPARAV